MPPRHAKSTTCSHYFPAQYLGTFPDHRVMLAAYNASFAATWGRKVRDTLQEHGPDVFGVGVRADSAAADEWQLAGREGGMKTDGAGGGFTGRGANLLIVDDPVKNAEEALSPTIRKRHKDWYDSTIDTRLEPDAVQLLIMTRWHADDLGGHVLTQWRVAGEPYEVLKLPGLAKEGDPLGRAPGEALWPERYPAEFFLAKRRLSPFWYSSLYDQEPTPEGGAIYKAEWFGRYRVVLDTDGRREALLLGRTGELVYLRDCAILCYVDPAVGKTRTGDEAAVGVYAVTPRGDLAVLHMVSRVIPLDDIAPAVAAVAEAWHPHAIGVESDGFQVTVARSVRKLVSCPVREVLTESRSKLARAVPAVELAAAGRLHVPEEAEWVGGYLTELTQWTAQDGDKDNQVDVTSYAAQDAQGRYAPAGDDGTGGSGGYGRG